jgi:hypothetical protein
MTIRQARWWEIDTEKDARMVGTSIFIREQPTKAHGEPVYSLEFYDHEHVFSLAEIERVVRDLQEFLKARRKEGA